jgi:hypothetical protein
MTSVIVRNTFWHSSVVQHLRALCPKDVRFRESTNVQADLMFPFSGSLAFTILYPDHLNDRGAREIELLTKAYSKSTLVLCISPDESDLYSDFLARIPSKVSAVVCFPHENFAKTAAKFIFQAAANAKETQRKIEKLVEERRRLYMNPDVQAPRIIDGLVRNEATRTALKAMLNTEAGTIRKTLVKGVPELFERDFYIEAGGESSQEDS